MNIEFIFLLLKCYFITNGTLKMYNLKSFFKKTFDAEGDYIAQFSSEQAKDKESDYSTKGARLSEQKNSPNKVFDNNKIIINKLRDGCVIPKNKEELAMLVNKPETNLADIVIPENIIDLSKLFYKSVLQIIYSYLYLNYIFSKIQTPNFHYEIYHVQNVCLI